MSHFFDPRTLKSQKRAIAALLILLVSGCRQTSQSVSPEAPQQPLMSRSTPASCDRADPFATAANKAQTAANLAQNARSPQEWQKVALHWMQAIERMEAIPLSSPKRPFAEKKVREYQQNLVIAQNNAAVGQQLPFESFESRFLDEQLLLYLSYVAAMGTPDILVVGSSRALQGVDPQQLEAELAQRGQPNVKVFNFGVNGATAQVVDTIVREIIPPEQLPKLIIWADGVRAFNSGRVDRTYNAIAPSKGYQKLLTSGVRPTLPMEETNFDNDCDRTHGMSISQILNFFPIEMAQATDVNAINANGFLPDATRFNPATYYQKYPRVAGRYDSDYANLNLWGQQTVALKRLVAYTKEQNIPLIIVNLPLTQDYLDPVRQRAEQQFAAFMQYLAQQEGFVFTNFNQYSALQNNNLFTDPSHLNRFGAIAVSRQLITQPQIPWEKLTQPQ
ncbi:hypothetical protein IQ249_02950 [Lusitaniella coriacea LEGE 07157]|uniref:DUF1574 domain-containing protein n=1 Tax=Lusitaniella coriacea LEGE 07157 TaxID=945747 RepID=A0A8J7DSV8_9CYAN|nr:hypothetical protein [Lusitaniella coriacea]MBE9114847.1 hypothetical protein [Lusitaniella coriacea LEGE 07157]